MNEENGPQTGGTRVQSVDGNSNKMGNVIEEQTRLTKMLEEISGLLESRLSPIMEIGLKEPVETGENPSSSSIVNVLSDNNLRIKRVKDLLTNCMDRLHI